MNTKDDFLRECMSGFDKAPIDDFQYSYCRVCANRGCVRSALNNSVFDKRVNGWYEHLFLKVPRADEKDPNFAAIRSKKFVPLESSPLEINPIVSVPKSPPIVIVQQPEELKPVEIPMSLHSPTQPEVKREKSVPTPPAPVPIPEPFPLPLSASNTQIPVNTDYDQGMVLPGSPDPSPKDLVLEPGQTYTFGDK
jgi:hypothetical protein